MSGVLDPFRFVLIAVAGWMNQHQLKAHCAKELTRSYCIITVNEATKVSATD